MHRRARIPRPVGFLNERQYQRQVKEALDRLYGEVEIQWQPFRGQGPGIYAPVVNGSAEGSRGNHAHTASGCMCEGMSDSLIRPVAPAAGFSFKRCVKPG